jgi:hypothetical protein
MQRVIISRSRISSAAPSTGIGFSDVFGSDRLIAWPADVPSSKFPAELTSATLILAVPCVHDRRQYFASGKLPGMAARHLISERPLRQLSRVARFLASEVRGSTASMLHVYILSAPR